LLRELNITGKGPEIEEVLAAMKILSQPALQEATSLSDLDSVIARYANIVH